MTRRTLVLLLTAAAGLAAESAPREPLITGVDSIGMTVTDLDRSLHFYTDVLGFRKVSETEIAGEAIEHLQGVFGARARVARLQLGDEFIELSEYLAPEGRPMPAGTRGNDRWFQHIAIVVSDMDRAYRHLRDEPALAPQLVSLLAQELESARGQIAILNRRSAIEKLAAFILDLHRRQKNPPEIDLQPSRADIADFLGLTIETVSRNLTKLRTKRIIRLPTIHKLVILDSDRLEALAAGECENW